MDNTHVDVVVIGSGFGGSVVACRLAEAGKSVCVLERGRKYPPGAFPRTPKDMSRNFWDPSRRLYGMFNVWSFKGMEALVSSGLGGGSLIYANVLLRKPPEWFEENHAGHSPWPITYADLKPHYARVEERMNAQPYPVEHAPYSNTPKTVAMKKAAAELGLDWKLPPLAVTFGNDGDVPSPGEPIRERPNLHGKSRSTCRLCGECDIGCNYGSKNTLDFNYLTDAANAGADIRELCEVLEFEPRAEGGYTVRYVRHRPKEGYWKQEGQSFETITCDRLVLGAGTLGSTFLLLKNRTYFPDVSPRLGEQFCGNGDLLSFALKCGSGSGKNRRPRDMAPSLGPVITSTVRVPDTLDGSGSGRGYFVQDAGYPAFLSWVLETSSAASVVKRLARGLLRRVRALLRQDPRSDVGSEIADLLGGGALSSSSLPLLGMGRDVPDGRLSLVRDAKGEPHLANDWSIASSQAFFDRMMKTMVDITRVWGGKLLPNPTYRLGRVITVHPLGGCPMGASSEEGVVDAYGQVFGYPGFFIADGSVLPGPTGPNPALTIAAVADRAADYIIDSMED